MKGKILIGIILALSLLLVIQARKRKLNENFESSIAMAPKFGCDTSEKIEIKDMIHQCGCNSDSKESCVWTRNRQPVHGCPCEKPPKNTDYTCVKMAQILNCSDKKIECNGAIGQCECQDGSQCFWGGKKPLGGNCPCNGGRLPEDEDFEDEVKKAKRKNKKKKGTPVDNAKDDL